MKLVIKKSTDGAKLMDELFDAFPPWKGPKGPDGRREYVLLRVETTATEVRLDVPDDADESAVRAIVVAHDPAKPGKGEVRAKRRAEALARLKAKPEMADLVEALGL